MSLQSFKQLTNNKADKNLHYLDIYDRLFSEFSFPSILEIGVWQGESLRLWAEYLPTAKVVGIDNNFCTHLHPRVKFYQGNQSDVSFLEDVAKKEGQFDIVIDDASHRSGATLVSLRTIFPYVKKYYVIEDWACYTECSSIFDNNYQPQKNSEYLLDLAKNIMEELAIWRGSARKFGSSKFEKIEIYENLLVITKR